MIVGIASGSSTRRMISSSLIPIPRAASTAPRSTWRTPTNALVRIGGMPRIVTAIVTLRLPVPMKATISAIRASSGIARPALPTATARNSPTPRWPSQSPIGSAIAVASSSATTLIAIWVLSEVPDLTEAADLAAGLDRLALIEDEVDGAAERAEERGHERRGDQSARTFRHGAMKRCASTSSPSKLIASATARTLPKTMFVLKTSRWIPSL